MRDILVLTINAAELDCLLQLLKNLSRILQDGEEEGTGAGCKWWLDKKKVDD